MENIFWCFPLELLLQEFCNEYPWSLPTGVFAFRSLKVASIYFIATKEET